MITKKAENALDFAFLTLTEGIDNFLRSKLCSIAINPFLVAAAAELSPNLSPAQQADFSLLISRLTRPECDEFLLKIVNGEPGAVAALRKRLLSFEKPQTTLQTDPRTFGELLKTAEKLRNTAAKR